MEKREHDGAIVFDTPDGIAFFRLATLRSGLSLEIKGIRVGRGRTCYSILKGEGYKGNRAKVLKAVTAEVDRLVKERQGGEDRQPEVSFWTKDGMWHHTEPYEPSDEDRKMFPVSYPKGDDGPFFIWSSDSYDTKIEATTALWHKFEQVPS